MEGEDFDSDWWRWEQRPMRIRDGATSAQGSDHWRRYPEDIVWARKLGHNAIVISLSWARIQPTSGELEATALAHYRKVLETVREEGLEPICVLQEVVLPGWFARQGGWGASGSVACFTRYVQAVVGELRGLCSYWLPMLEPEYFLTRTLWVRDWPGSVSRWRSRAVVRNVIRGWCAAQRILHDSNSTAQVGMSIRAATFEPQEAYSPWDTWLAQRENHRWRHRMLRSVLQKKAQVDFIALSDGGHLYTRFSPWRYLGGKACYTDVSGRREQNPAQNARRASDLASIAGDFTEYQLPLICIGGEQEGAAEERVDFLEQQLHALRALSGQEGSCVQGYFYRTLLDGFEWEQGYRRRYGLLHVDRESLARTPNQIAFLLKKYCENSWKQVQ